MSRTIDETDPSNWKKGMGEKGRGREVELSRKDIQQCFSRIIICFQEAAPAAYFCAWSKFGPVDGKILGILPYH